MRMEDPAMSPVFRTAPAAHPGGRITIPTRPLLGLAGSGRQAELFGSADRGATVVHAKLVEDVLRVRPHGAQ
jgi:hypothetical protein